LEEARKDQADKNAAYSAAQQATKEAQSEADAATDAQTAAQTAVDKANTAVAAAQAKIDTADKQGTAPCNEHPYQQEQHEVVSIVFGQQHDRHDNEYPICRTHHQTVQPTVSASFHISDSVTGS